MHRIVVFALALVALPTMALADDPKDLQGNPHTLNNLVWMTGAPTPFHRVESPTAVVDGKLYLFGGFTEELDGSHQVDAYDPTLDTWIRLKDMPSGTTHLNAVVDGHTIWLAGGFKGRHPGSATDEVWKYDVGKDSWTRGTPLPEARAGGGLSLVDGRLHYFGGLKDDRQTTAGDHWSLAIDGGTKWETEAEMPNPRGHLAQAVLDGKIYALGGTDGHDKSQIDVAFCNVYDPATKQWSEIAALPDGRSHVESSTLIYRGRILLVGGRSNSPEPAKGVLNEILAYDPKTNTWKLVGTMSEKVLAPSAAIIGRKIIVSGGGLGNPRPLTSTTHVATLPE